MAQIRGLYTFQDVLYVVRSDTLYSIDGSGFARALANLRSSAGVIDFTENLTQLQFTDGAYLYVWDGSTLRVAIGFVPGRRIGNLVQRTVFIESASQRFHWSEPGDALNIPALNFASAESVPDQLVGMVISNGDIWLGGQFSTEVWAVSQSVTVFEKYRGSAIRFGVAGAHTMRECGSTPIWLSRTKDGVTCVVRGNGQQAEPISNRAVEDSLRGRVLTYASAFTFADGKQELYALNVPGLTTTWVYNATSGQWHENADWRTGREERWRPTCHAFAYGKHWFGDIDGNLYYGDDNVSNNDGDPLVRFRVCPVMGRQDGDYMHFGRAEMVCKRATGGTVMVRYRNDPQGANSKWRYASTGDAGEQSSRIVVNRLGAAKGMNGRVYEVRMTSDTPFNPVTVDFRTDLEG